jgi:hypothetical protein
MSNDMVLSYDIWSNQVDKKIWYQTVTKSFVGEVAHEIMLC